MKTRSAEAGRLHKFVQQSWYGTGAIYPETCYVARWNRAKQTLPIAKSSRRCWKDVMGGTMEERPVKHIRAFSKNTTVKVQNNIDGRLRENKTNGK